MINDPYKLLGVSKDTPFNEIKAAYRALAKKFHPDTGTGEDNNKILAINAAWETIRNNDNQIKNAPGPKRNRAAAVNYQTPVKKGSGKDEEISLWVKVVYIPIDRLMGEVINPFPRKLKELSADPYDDLLMAGFCEYIEKSKKRLTKAKDLYQSLTTPLEAKHFSLSLYQCFSELQDGINELERYTAGYVESYLHDGHEMLRKAQKKRLLLKKDKISF